MVCTQVLPSEARHGGHVRLEDDLHGGRGGGGFEEEEVIQASCQHHQDKVSNEAPIFGVIGVVILTIGIIITIVIIIIVTICYSQRLSLGMTSHMKGRLLAKAELPGEVCIAILSC